MPRRTDTRLTHLLKLQRQARADVTRYVQRKWPVGSRVSYTHKQVKCVGTVCSHGIDGQTVVVLDALRRKVHVHYSQLTERRGS